MPDTPPDVDRRLMDLEVKLSFTEDLVEHLNLAVARQQRQMEALVLELRRLQQLYRDADAAGSARTLRDELPPHY